MPGDDCAVLGCGNEIGIGFLTLFRRSHLNCIVKIKPEVDRHTNIIKCMMSLLPYNFSCLI
jgi:hypothetical protein